MSLTLGEIAAAIDEVAPFRLAYEWDNVGLQIGDSSQPVEKLLIALEVNNDVIAHARAHACSGLLTHHPLIFKPLKNVRADKPGGHLITQLIRAEIGLICAHTNLDRVLRGTNGALAAKIGLTGVTVLEPTALDEQFKFTVFVPREYTSQVIEAIHRGGGGWIGKYSHCTFRAPGKGTYVPEHGSSPFAGSEGKFEEAEEDRLETVVSRRALTPVLNEVMKAHPYEEVAYDVFPLHDANPKFGLGAVGTLPESISLQNLAEKLCAACSVEQVQVIGLRDAAVTRVGIISGSAGSSVRSLPGRSVDVLITGELSYHYAQEAADMGMRVIMLGHAASEKVFASYFRDELLKETMIAESDLIIEVYENFPEPFHYMGNKV